VLSDATGLLRCPHCAAPLVFGDGRLTCGTGHSFDVARQGYVNLLPGDAGTGTADPLEMVQARASFLAGGSYAPIARHVSEAIQQFAPPSGCVVDLGAGTGYYLDAVLAQQPDRVGLALDLSKYAARIAASAERVASVVCDAWQPLPVVDGIAGAVLSVFSPRNPGEIARILAPDGVLVVVVPTDRHLSELIAALGLLSVDVRKRERLDDKLRSRFDLVEERQVEFPLQLDRDTLRTLIAMGPSAYHLDPSEIERRIAAIAEPADVTASVTVAAFRLGADGDGQPPSP
jgi:23S rRNA (guanine745-N1)-methyltransferase